MSRPGEASSNQQGQQTVLGVPRGDRLVLLVGLPALAVLIGFLLPPLARWLLGLDVPLPVTPAFKFVGAVDQGWEIGLNLGIWLIAGLILGVIGMVESVTLVLTNDQLQITKDEQTSLVARADVATVYRDGKEFVVLDRRSRQLAREKPAAPMAAVADAFQRHLFPWRDADPYAHLFRPWSLGTGELPDSVNAVLSARQAALKNKSTQQIDELRDAVEKLGYAVREEGHRQYWRPLTPGPAR